MLSRSLGVFFCFLRPRFDASDIRPTTLYSLCRRASPRQMILRRVAQFDEIERRQRRPNSRSEKGKEGKKEKEKRRERRRMRGDSARKRPLNSRRVASFYSIGATIKASVREGESNSELHWRRPLLSESARCAEQRDSSCAITHTCAHGIMCNANISARGDTCLFLRSIYLWGGLPRFPGRTISAGDTADEPKAKFLRKYTNARTIRTAHYVHGCRGRRFKRAINILYER